MTKTVTVQKIKKIVEKGIVQAPVRDNTYGFPVGLISKVCIRLMFSAKPIELGGSVRPIFSAKPIELGGSVRPIFSAKPIELGGSVRPIFSAKPMHA